MSSTAWLFKAPEAIVGGVSFIAIAEFRQEMEGSFG